jgi:two-component system CheB/CheR fusion protein
MPKTRSRFKSSNTRPARVESSTTSPVPVVALGGSAGSLNFIAQFLSAIPADSGLTFVLALHLSPEHISNLPAILASRCRLRVLQPASKQTIEPNHVYVIPPAKKLTVVGNRLEVGPLEPQLGVRTAVDDLFHSVADQYGSRAAAVVFSGADSDGAAGLIHIKRRGGLTLVQDPSETEHREMPRAAIATGSVDAVLSIAAMPARVLEHFTQERRVPPVDVGGPRPLTPEEEAWIEDLLIAIQAGTGRDVHYYRRSTVWRQAERRMTMTGVSDRRDYLQWLSSDHDEANALVRDLLVSVTGFFRDPDAFRALQQFVPDLFKGKYETDSVRVWVPGCATGEEAYSVAMLLLEQAQAIPNPPTVQVFAGDLDAAAVETARGGHYPEAIAAAVGAERLRQFFTRDPSGFRVRRSLRHAVLFAVHDVVKDAALARMDLVSCRNLLIYLQSDAQRRMFDMFHFALRPGGVLFLGTAESVDEDRQQFEPLDRQHSIYRRLPGRAMAAHRFADPSALLRALRNENALRPDPLASISNLPPAALDAVEFPGTGVVLADLHLKLIERLAPASAVVDADHHLVHLSAKMGRFLQFRGSMTTELPRLVGRALRPRLRGALARAAHTRATVTIPRATVVVDGRECEVSISVSPADDLAPQHLLVTFDDMAPANGPCGTATSPTIRDMEQEIEILRTRLEETTTRAELNSAELRASNQELRAINQELRAATEEVEINRQELQAINEELSTVNQELGINLDDLGRVNADLRNFMNATAIPTVFLDDELRIKRYTPSAADLLNVLPVDIDRPLAHLRHELEYPALLDDARRVLATSEPIEHEVRDTYGRWFIVRLLPYHTVEGVVAGVVLTFVDVSRRKQAELELQESRAHLARELEDTRLLQRLSSLLIEDEGTDGLYEQVLDVAMAIMRSEFASFQRLNADRAELDLLAWRNFHPESARFWRRVSVHTGTTCGSALQHGERVIVPDAFAAGVPIGAETLQHYRLNGIAAVQSTPLTTRDGRVVGMISTYWREPHQPSDRDLAIFDVLARQAADVLERRRAQDALRESEATLQARNEELERFNQAVVGRELRMIELKKEVNELRGRRGQRARYPLEFESKDDAPAH